MKRTALFILVGLTIVAAGCSEESDRVVAPGPVGDPDRLPTFSESWEAVHRTDGRLANPGTSAAAYEGGLWMRGSLVTPLCRYDDSGSLLERWYITIDADTLVPVHIVASRGKYYAVASGKIVVFDRQREFLQSWDSRYPRSAEPAFASLDTDAAGNVYKLQFDEELVVKYGPDGQFITEWSTHGSDPFGDNWPGGISVTAAGEVYVADTLHDRILRFSSTGALKQEWGEDGIGPGQFRWPTGLAFDDQGYLFVVDRINERVQKFTRDGDYLGEFPSKVIVPGSPTTPQGIVIASNDVFVIHPSINLVRRYSFTDDS